MNRMDGAYLLRGCRRALFATTCCLISATLLARIQSASGRPPIAGQPGKDVPYEPTPSVLVEKMLDLAHVAGGDFVIDLGSGDGRVVIAAARRGARSHGIEYDLNLVALSRAAAASAHVADRATFSQEDLLVSDFSRATVLTMFLLPEINMQLRPRILAMRPGARVVSNTWMMQDWQPDDSVTIRDCRTFCAAHLWIVPAKVEGRWRTADGDLVLEQHFQRVSGTLRSVPIQGRLRGETIAFSASSGAQYSGVVNGEMIAGTVTTRVGKTEWRATRIEKPAH
jgi:hypothetical protein